MTSTKSSLRGKKVAVLAADGFEWIAECADKALKRAGATVEVISLHYGKVRGVNLTAPTRTVRVDKTIEEANPHDYDALLIPGGFEIKPPGAPEGPEAGASLAQAIASHCRELVALLLCSLSIGVYWLSHHYSGRIYTRSDHVSA